MSTSIQLLADEHLFLLENCLPDEVELTTYDPNRGIPENVQEFDALFVRTVNPINASTIPAGPEKLKLIASATAGIDHVDTDYLKEQDILFRYAPGCNARSVGEYISTALLLWYAETGYDPGELKVGIIGFGHTGGAVADLLEQLEIPFLAYDPPKEKREPDFNSCTLDELLHCDILSFHTPLTNTGKHATFHWLDEPILKEYSFELVINAARGGIINEKSLYKAFQRETVSHYILDVWENEPIFNDLLANKSFFNTPHIAGYSRQAKWRASSMIATELAEYFGLNPPDTTFPKDQLQDPSPALAENADLSFAKLLKLVHPIAEYDKRFEKLIGLQPEKKSIAYQELRTRFSLRDEFSYIHFPQQIFDKYPLLKMLGLAKQ